MRAWRTPSAQWDDDSFWKCNNLRGCLISFCCCKMFRNMKLFGSSIVFSLILEKWNCNGQRRKQLEARVAFFFLRLLTCDQQTKWVRAGFHSTSSGFPHSPRWGFRIFFTKRDLTSFPDLFPLLQAPLGAPCFQLGHLYTQIPPGSCRLAWDTCFCDTPLIPCLPLWLTHRLSLGMVSHYPGREKRQREGLADVC